MLELLAFLQMHKHMNMMGHPQVSMQRHRIYHMQGVPENYRGKRNPYATDDEDVVSKGKEIYETYCLACHGKDGKGDGPAGKELSPKPSDLSFIMKRHIATDEYLFWTISEGGKPVGSSMPAYKDVLSEEEIWAVITYLRYRFGR